MVDQIREESRVARTGEPDIDERHTTGKTSSKSKAMVPVQDQDPRRELPRQHEDTRDRDSEETRQSSSTTHMVVNSQIEDEPGLPDPERTSTRSMVVAETAGRVDMPRSEPLRVDEPHRLAERSRDTRTRKRSPVQTDPGHSRIGEDSSDEGERETGHNNYRADAWTKSPDATVAPPKRGHRA